MMAALRSIGEDCPFFLLAKSQKTMAIGIGSRKQKRERAAMLALAVALKVSSGDDEEEEVVLGAPQLSSRRWLPSEFHALVERTHQLLSGDARLCEVARAGHGGLDICAAPLCY